MSNGKRREFNARGRVIVLSGPSGVGKTTIHSEILKRRPDLCTSVSATSRPKRKGEVHGREYFFLSEKEFMVWVDTGRFIEYARVHNNWYGTPKEKLIETIENGCHVLMDVDVQGAKALMELFPDGIYFFIEPPDLKELEERLRKRNTDRHEEIEGRLRRAADELKYKKDYTHVIENKTVNAAVEKILSILDAEVGEG
ncbi:hypothetical protein AMJ87_07905 [candidate division WOR_3 bacterium SM23_60]|uniref:Guanylate kinase n=1 Tax=candidate division WOR_3 bacterium SM23_60 TaxID=1703780 RepID=A0A0S8GEW3_UNCW3|nr:MAG: hypothetical protein AMJ87_07905 [candidate division WOR_3 bacterium SM23_60]